MAMRTYNRSFASGELSPEMFGRIDDAKFQTGAALMRNFIATPQGPAENRAGFEYVCSTKNNGVARLIPFTYSNDQTMVVEMGEGYFRFHTQGGTLLYSITGMRGWIPPSGALSLSYTTPSIVTWPGHRLSSGDPIRFYLYGSHSATELPPGLKVGYTYIADVIDVDTFRILDNGIPVALPAIAGGGGVGFTHYAGAGTASAAIGLGPNQNMSNTSGTLGGLPSTVVAGGLATLNVSIDVTEERNGGTGSALFQYSTGAGWNAFEFTTLTKTTTIQIQIPIANLDQLQLQIVVSGHTTSNGSLDVSADITAWSVDVPTDPGPGPGLGGLDFVRAYRYYTSGNFVSLSGSYYTAVQQDSGGMTQPGLDGTIWALLPSDLIYEIPSPYLLADLFYIHYVQSNDVVTLVHPNYPPQELRRTAATMWSLTPISFAPTVGTPSAVALVSSPGYKSQIASMSSASPSIIQTVSNHTLAIGDGIYISGETGLADDFYQVEKIPKDGTGADITNQLIITDYDGNEIGGGTYSGSGTIEYGSKIFDIDNYYAVTAVSSDGVQESTASDAAHAINNLYVSGSYNTISWAAVPAALRYYVYKRKSGLYGYIGQTTDMTFVDNNIAPDMGQTPPIYDAMFGSAGNYPAAVSYVDQRRVFGGTSNQPQNIWMSKSGTESDFSYSLPVKDSDRVAFRIAARERATIRHIVPLAECVLLTSSGELRITPVNSDAITPTTIAVKPQSYVGANNVQPHVVNNSLVYCAARGGHIRELGYSFQASGFITGDLSLRASHLFDNLTIVDQAYSKAPRPIVWFVSSNGVLLGLTYVPEEQIGSWHQHTTDGAFESIAAVCEGNEDRLYAVINRTIGGNTVRYIERMASRLFDSLQDCFFVDAGLTYSGDPETVISGLGHLEGKTVSILADGGVRPQQVVTDGKITLDHTASLVTVGLPYTSDLQTLPMTLQIDGFGQGRMKNINKSIVRVWKSSGVFIGPDADHLTEAKQRSTEPYGTPPSLKNDDIPVMLTPSWQASGQIFVRQSYPLPLSIVGMTLEVEIGG